MCSNVTIETMEVCSNVTIETIGVCSNEAIAFIAELGRRITERTGDIKESVYLYQQILVAIKRGNMMMIIIITHIYIVSK